MARRKDKRIIRAKIVTAAAKRLHCTIKEIFMRAKKGAHDVVVNLNKIPEYVIRYARRVLSQHLTKRTKKRRQQYFRGAPFMRAC